MPAEAGLAAGERMAPDPAQIQQLRPALREMYAELLVDHPEHVRQPLIDAHVSDNGCRPVSPSAATWSHSPTNCGPDRTFPTSR